VNQLAQRAFIYAKTVGCVESTRPAAAQPAHALFIEWEWILKRRTAAYAKIICFYRRDARQARRANRNARKLGQSDLADAAFIGKNERKKAVRNLAENGGECDQGT